MERIRVLDSSVSNKIAAGEVVERPASVIKELVENSIDARATSISVEIADGGLTYMRVADNGTGIDCEDVSTAFLRHATSKIASEQDLYKISTLGFRGEALSSIASVSNVALRTRTEASDFGASVSASGGNVEEALPCGCPEGTVIEVCDLFFNVPARLKFMKSPRNEAALISDYISRMILAHPDIAFKYVSGGKTVYSSAGDGSLESAIYTVYGSEVSQNLKRLEAYNGYVRISGYIGTEAISRPTRTWQSFFLNGRYIRQQKLSNALSDAYDTRLMGGRFPVCVINIEIDYAEVDVNVHPNKLEVRFKNEQCVLDEITDAVRQALGGYSAPTIVQPPASSQNNIIATDTTAMPFEANKIEKDSQPHGDAVRGDEHKHSVSQQTGIFPEKCADVYENEEESIFPDNIPVIPIPKAIPDPEPELRQLSFEFMPYKVLSSVFDTFWFVQQGEAVLIIDQHAAHERLLYEKLMSGKAQADSQLLLIPEIIKLPPVEYDTYIECVDAFEALGFAIEPFGALTVRITAVPHALGKAQKAEFLHDVLATLARTKNTDIREAMQNAIISTSCKYAVKAGSPIPEETLERILKEYQSGEIPLTCPHGRPVMVAMTKNALYKMFKRI